jgi:hypothetical protein
VAGSEDEVGVHDRASLVMRRVTMQTTDSTPQMTTAARLRWYR